MCSLDLNLAYEFNKIGADVQIIRTNSLSSFFINFMSIKNLMQ